MTSPQQPQAPQPEPNDAVPAQLPVPAEAPQAQQPPQAPAQPAAPVDPRQEPGTMMLQAQGQPRPQGEPVAAPAPAREAGTMMLQAQQQPAAPPQRQDAGTMMLQAQGAPDRAQQAPVPPQADPRLQGYPQQAPQQPQGQAQPPANWQAASDSYVSPIPIRRTHLGHALASEWTKIRSVRSTMWTLGSMILLVLGIGLLAAATVSGSVTELRASPLSFGTFGMMLGLICVLTLGVLVISSEYGTGMIRTTLTACPSRARVLTAKAIVFFGVTFVVSLVTTALVAVLDNAMLGGIEGTPTPTGGEWIKATVGVSLFVAALGLVALALGAMLRHSAGAITAMIGLYLLPLVLAIFMQGESLADIQQFLLEYSIPSQLGTMYSNAVTDSGPSGWQPLWIVGGLAAAGLGGAYAALLKRDV